MRPGETDSGTGQWKSGPARAAGWALLGALSLLFGWEITVGLESWGMNAQWRYSRESFMPFVVSLGSLVAGLTYTGVLAFAVHRTRLAGWRRAAGFAVLAMPWLAFAFNAGLAVYDIGEALIGNDWWTPAPLFAFLVWFVGLLVGGIWVTLAGLVLLPFLRSRRSAAWLLAAGAVFGVPAGALAVVDFDAALDAMQFVFAGWCAVYAAAFAMTLRRAQRDAGGPIPGNNGLS